MMQKKQPYKAKPAKKVVALQENPGAQKKLRNTLSIFIAVFAFALYAQSISFKYALDDGTVVKDNFLTTKGLKSIPAHSYNGLLVWCFNIGFHNIARLH